MKHRVWILFIATMTAGAAADAAEYWTSCNSCSESQSQRAALQAVPEHTFGSHDVYVADFDRETIARHVVRWDYDAEFRAWDNSVWPVSTDVHVEYEFAQLVGTMKADVASLESGKVIPAEVVGSAYDLVHSSVNRQRVASYIVGHMSLWEALGAPVFVPLALLRKVVDLNLTVSVVFADGSTAQFVLTGVDGSLGELEYVFELVDDSARDPDGNVIPDSVTDAAPFEGTFSSEQRAQRMADFVRIWYGAPREPLILCSFRQVGNNIIVTCKRY